MLRRDFYFRGLLEPLGPEPNPLMLARSTRRSRPPSIKVIIRRAVWMYLRFPLNSRNVRGWPCPG